MNSGGLRSTATPSSSTLPLPTNLTLERGIYAASTSFGMRLMKRHKCRAPVQRRLARKKVQAGPSWVASLGRGRIGLGRGLAYGIRFGAARTAALRDRRQVQPRDRLQDDRR